MYTYYWSHLSSLSLGDQNMEADHVIQIRLLLAGL